MRNVVSYFVSSLDGVIEEPSDWAFDAIDDEMIEFLAATIATQDAVLLGRNTYEMWAPIWPESDFEPFASFINDTPKYVVSTTMKEAAWSNSTVWNGDVAARVAALKAERGNDIGVHGSATLVRTLVRNGLLDDLRLALLPVVAGKGERLFDDFEDVQRLELVQMNRTLTGIVLLEYRLRRD